MKACLGIDALRRAGWCLLLTLGLQVAHAGACVGVVCGGYTLGGDRDGYPGEEVSLKVTESALSGLDGAQLTFTYDSTVLSFKDVGASSYGFMSPFLLSDAGGFATYSLFLVADRTTNGDVELFSLVFNINNLASAGPTPITITNDLSAPFAAGIYDRQSIDGATVTVLARTSSVPIIGSHVLTLTALALLPLGRRMRRRPLHTAQPQAAGPPA